MALLALFVKKSGEMSLDKYLTDVIFAGEKEETVVADDADVKGFDEFMARFVKTLPVERAAVDVLK